MTRHQPHRESGAPLQYDPDFQGPLKSRSCTDVIFLVIFILFIACWIGIGIFALTSGDPQSLLVPVASDGSRCGWDSHVRDKPYLFFFDLTKCIDIKVPFTKCKTKQVCVEKCPSTYYNKNDRSTVLDRTFCYTTQTTTQCPDWYLPSEPVVDRCVPIFDNSVKAWINELVKEFNINEDHFVKAAQELKNFLKVEEVGQNIVDDIVSSWWQILIAVGAALLINLIYILIMRWIAAFMVWLSIIGVIAILVAGLYFTGKHYVYLKNNPHGAYEADSIMGNNTFWMTLLIILSCLLLILLLVLIFLRKRILLAIELVKEGSKAVSSVTSVLFFPIFPWILQIGVIVFAITCGLYLASTGEPEYLVKSDGKGVCYKENTSCSPDNFYMPGCVCKYIQVKNPRFYPYLQAINIFGFFWGVFFVSAMGQMILASVFATWYWTFRKRNLPFFAVTEATGRVLRYHIGTLAFGSLIITICRIIRVMLEYIDHKLKKYDNELVKAIMCCMKCFFWCLEKFLKFINRNAYIMCAIHGKNFCASAKDAFLLLSRNILRFFVLDKVTDFLFFLSKIMLVAAVGAIAYVCFATNLTPIDNSYLKYNIVPVVIIMVITYFIATLFFSVYSMAVDTLFLCFLEDCERNDGTPEKPYFMSKNLMKIFGKKNKIE